MVVAKQNFALLQGVDASFCASSWVGRWRQRPRGGEAAGRALFLRGGLVNFGIMYKRIALAS
jgi:hypothetical protein